MISKFMISALAVGALASSQSLSARDFLAFQSTTPMLYRYAACALALDEPTVEEQLARCEDLRNSLDDEADIILTKFHLADRRKAKLNLKRGFREIDQDAKRAREQLKTAPPSILAYLSCMGERVMQTADYREGIAVDYFGIEDLCATEHVLSVTWVASEQELERLQILYRRFVRQGRYVDNTSRLGAGIASTRDGHGSRLPARGLSRSRGAPPFFVVMENSFLDLATLPADEEQSDG